MGGIEAEYLTRTAYSVTTALQQTGRIPLWDPFMELGDPMLTNPVAFYFNPLLMGPSFLFGPYNGIKLSIVLSAVVVGLGGWALGRVLGLGPLARLLLAFLCIGKGNMHSFLSQGHFAFYASQAYFPWIFAGVIAIFRGSRRWPVILIAVAFAMIFFAGSPWYPPALVVCIGILVLFYGVSIRRGRGNRPAVQIAWGKLAPLIAALVLALCLSAVEFIPLWVNRDAIGGSQIYTDFRADLGTVFSQYFSGVKVIDDPVHFPEGNSFAFYSYVLPVWFALLLLALSAIVIFARRRLPEFPWRAVGAGVVIFLFCTFWGAGQNPVVELFYRVIPLSNQFRHVERVLALSSLWLAVLVAIVVDWLWRSLVHGAASLGLKRVFGSAQRWRWVMASGLVLCSGLAGVDVMAKWHVSWGAFFVRPEDQWEDYCISWLRGQHPDAQLSVWTLAYRNAYTYIRNEVRMGFAPSDFYHARPLPSTMFLGDLVPRNGGPNELLPQYALGPPHYDVSWMESHGYRAVPESANPYDSNHAPCLYERADYLAYAFQIGRRDLNTYVDNLPPSATTPIHAVWREYDRVILQAQARTDDNVVVALRELAYPGWQVTVDEKPAQLESVGGMAGVLLPPDGRRHAILFQYLPFDFYFGAAITLVTAVGFILYLLRADRYLPDQWNRRFVSQVVDAWDLGDPDGT